MGQHEGGAARKVSEPDASETAGTRPIGWVDRLLNDVMAFDEMSFQPSGKAEKGDVVVGECTPYMRKLYAFARHCERESEHSAIDLKHMNDHSSDEFRNIRMLYEEMGTKQKLLISMFWAEVNERFHTWGDARSLGLVKDWKVVQREHDHEHTHGGIDVDDLPSEIQGLIKMLKRGGRGGILGIGMEPLDPE